MTKLSERAWALVNASLHREFDRIAEEVSALRMTPEEFGWWCESLDEVAEFCHVAKHMGSTFQEMGRDWLEKLGCP